MLNPFPSPGERVCEGIELWAFAGCSKLFAEYESVCGLRTLRVIMRRLS
jgi:hypothetical protein